MNRRDFLATTSAAAVTASMLGGGRGLAAATPAGKPKLQRGVSLYSYQEEFYTRDMNLEDCLAELASIGATGVQVIAEEMVPNYPNPPQAWVDNWHAMLAKYRLTPTNLDTFVDIYRGGHRTMSLQESVDTLVGQVKLANRLGFKVVRPTTGPVETPAVEMVEHALAEADKYDVRIAPEIHAPIPLQGNYVESYLELIHRTGTKHLGFTLDCGVFCKRLPRVMTEYWKRHGAEQRVVDFVDKAFLDGMDKDKIVEGARKINPTEANLTLAMFAWGYGPVSNSPSQLKAMAPYIYNVHGKFYEMTDELTEYSIPYKEIFAALGDLGYAHSIDSEYEGQRWTQDVIATDSCEAVRREHVMFRRLMGEIA
jgi:sugar phosphate isomerase/epimerase